MSVVVDVKAGAELSVVRAQHWRYVVKLNVALHMVALTTASAGRSPCGCCHLGDRVWRDCERIGSPDVAETVGRNYAREVCAAWGEGACEFVRVDPMEGRP